MSVRASILASVLAAALLFASPPLQERFGYLFAFALTGALALSLAVRLLVSRRRRRADKPPAAD